MSKAGGDRFDVAVVGGGAVGLAAALSAARAGLRSVVFAPDATAPPGRTAALLQGSIDILSDLGVWPELMTAAAPLRAIRIVDATQRLIRAPETTFHSSDIGLPAFGYNVPNQDLVAALRRRASRAEGLRLFESPVESIDIEGDRVSLGDGVNAASAQLMVAGDGARSAAREAAGIRLRNWGYPQSALVATFATALPHGGVSTEFHTEAGPFTLVPLPGERVSLVWVDRPEISARMASLDADELGRVVEAKARSIHGAMRLDSKPAVFPLRAALAERFAARRTMLVGEAAHQFPPIGAQGLNLGFRDVAALARVLRRFPGDPGSPAALDAYHRSRQADIRTRTLAVDLLNRSLLTDFLPVQAARGLGLALAAGVPVLRRAMMRQGLASAERSGVAQSADKDASERAPD